MPPIENSDDSQVTAAGATPAAPSGTGPAVGEPIAPDVGERTDDTPGNGAGQSDPSTDGAAPIGDSNGEPAPARKRGRPSNAEKAARADPQAQATRERLTSSGKAGPRPQPQQAQTAASAVNYDTMGQTAAMLWISMGCLIFGPDWAPGEPVPGQPLEGDILASGFAKYFKSKNMIAISPGFELAFILGSYTAVRLQRPTVKTRFQSIVQWAKNKFRR